MCMCACVHTHVCPCVCVPTRVHAPPSHQPCRESCQALNMLPASSSCHCQPMPEPGGKGSFQKAAPAPLFPLLPQLMSPAALRTLPTLSHPDGSTLGSSPLTSLWSPGSISVLSVGAGSCLHPTALCGVEGNFFVTT